MISAGTAILATLLAAGACRSNEEPKASNEAPKAQPAAPASAPGSAVDPWADNGAPELPPPRVTNPFERPFVWSATRDGKTTYLFGTVHGGYAATLLDSACGVGIQSTLPQGRGTATPPSA